jgi:hypothetical protein
MKTTLYEKSELLFVSPREYEQKNFQYEFSMRGVV